MHVSNKDLNRVKSLLDLIIKNSYTEKEVEEDEDWLSAARMCILSKLRISPSYTPLPIKEVKSWV